MTFYQAVDESVGSAGGFGEFVRRAKMRMNQLLSSHPPLCDRIKALSRDVDDEDSNFFFLLNSAF